MSDNVWAVGGACYQQACDDGTGRGVHLRREGLCPSPSTEGRGPRSAAFRACKNPGEVLGKPSDEQAVIRRLRR